MRFEYLIIVARTYLVKATPSNGYSCAKANIILSCIFNVKDTLLADECHSSHIALLLGFKYQNFISLDLYSLEISSMCIDIGTY